MPLLLTGCSTRGSPIPPSAWQVMRDLIDAPPSEWEGEGAKVEIEGRGARLLDLQDEDGQWAGGGFFPHGFDFNGAYFGVNMCPWR